MNSQTFRGGLPPPYPPAAKPLGGQQTSISSHAWLPLLRANLARAELRLGRTEDAKQTIRELLDGLPPGPMLPNQTPGGADFHRGLAYAMLGDDDRALAALESARRHSSANLYDYEYHGVTRDTDGVYGTLPDDPRFRALLERTAEEERALRERIKAELPELRDPAALPKPPVGPCRDVNPAPTTVCRSDFGDALLPNGARSFADAVHRIEADEFLTDRNRAAADEQAVIGPPSGRPTALWLGRSGVLEVGFRDNALTNSGDERPDLYIFYGASSQTPVFIGLHPADAGTRQAVERTCIESEGGYCDSYLSEHWAIDIDRRFPGFPAGALRFDAVRLRGDPAKTSSSTGARIEAIAAIDWR